MQVRGDAADPLDGDAEVSLAGGAAQAVQALGGVLRGGGAAGARRKLEGETG